jgi:hypothetical protein
MKIRGIIARTGYVESCSVGFLFFENKNPDKEFANKAEALTDLAKTLFHYWMIDNRNYLSTQCSMCKEEVTKTAKFCPACGSNKLEKQTESSVSVAEMFANDICGLAGANAGESPCSEFYDDKNWNMFGNIFTMCNHPREEFIYIGESFEVLVATLIIPEYCGTNSRQVKLLITELSK